MSKVIEGKNEIIEIQKEDLLLRAIEMKKKGLRLSQICAAWADKKYELSYSFADDETYDYFTLRVLAEKEEEIPSVTEVFPMAVFYENEMKELFGVKIQMISEDLHDRLYRIDTKTPFLPEEDR